MREAKNYTLTDEQRKFVEENHNLILGALNKYGFSYDDYYDAAAYGLCKAGASFDKNRGVKFSVYVYRCILNEVRMAIRSQKKAIQTTSLDIPINTQESNSDDEMYLKDVLASTEDTEAEAIERIDMCNRLVYLTTLELRALNLSISGYNQAEVANKLEKSKSYISRLLRKSFDLITYKDDITYARMKVSYRWNYTNDEYETRLSEIKKIVQFICQCSNTEVEETVKKLMAENDSKVRNVNVALENKRGTRREPISANKDINNLKNSILKHNEDAEKPIQLIETTPKRRGRRKKVVEPVEKSTDIVKTEPIIENNTAVESAKPVEVRQDTSTKLEESTINQTLKNNYLTTTPITESNIYKSLKIAIYPGSFDPITKGHLNIIKRASLMFDKVIVAVGINEDKKCLFSIEERKQLIRLSCSDFSNIEVDSFEGLLAEYVKKIGAVAVIRGIRNVDDLKFEDRLASINSTINPALDTVFLLPDSRYANISSSLVKQVGKMGGSIENMVHKQIISKVQERIKEEQK